MSEHKLAEMIGDLERENKRSGYEKKTQEVIDALENEEVGKFLKVYATIEHSTTKNDETDLGSTNILTDRLYELANERLAETHFEFFDRMTVELEKAARIKGQYLRQDGKSVYESFIDDEIKLPTVNQFEKCCEKGFDQFLLIPRTSFENIESRLKEDLDLIKGELLMPLYIDMNQHQGNPGYEVIALQHFGLDASDGIGAKSGSHNPRDKRFFEWRRAVDEHLVLDQDKTMSLRGLTLKEYLMMQLVHVGELIQVKESMGQSRSGIQLLDNASDYYAALLTGSWRSDNDGKTGEFLSARWDSTTRQLMINPHTNRSTVFFPWYAIHFDKIKGNESELEA